MNEQEIKYLIENYKTPFYFFDMNILKERIEFLKSKLPQKVKLCYAIKANSFILKDIEDLVERFEVCSFGEYHICDSSNIAKSKIVLSGVSKEENEIESFFENNIPIGIYTIESFAQYKLLKKLCLKYHQNIKVLLRLTSGNQFGMDKSVIHDILTEIKSEKFSNFTILGLQYFSTTQKRSLKRLAKELSEVTTFFNELNETYEANLTEIEFGPGLSAAYFKDEEYNEEEYLNEFANLLDSIPSNINITLELGRSITYNCGSFFTKVVDIKTNKKENYAIVDGGIHHLVYYGQSLAMRIPEIIIYKNNHILSSNKENNKEENWNICGSLCTINDILIKQLPINDLQIGDYLIFKRVGAYSVTEGISLFLSRNLPSIIKKDRQGNYQQIRKNLPIYSLNTPNLERSDN